MAFGDGFYVDHTVQSQAIPPRVGAVEGGGYDGSVSVCIPHPSLVGHVWRRGTYMGMGNRTGTFTITQRSRKSMYLNTN